MALRLGHRPMAPLTLARQRDTARCRPAHRNKKLPPPTPDLSAAAGIPATDQATTQDTDTTRQRDHPQATTNTSAPQAQHPGEQQAAQPDEEPQQRTEADAGHCSQRVANKNRQVGMETSPCTDRATKPRRPWVGLPGYLYRQRDRPAGAVHPTHHSTRRQPAEHPTNITDRTCHSTTDGRPTPANNQHTRCRAFKHAKHTPTAGGRHQPRPTTPSHTHTHTHTHSWQSVEAQLMEIRRLASNTTQEPIARAADNALIDLLVDSHEPRRRGMPATTTQTHPEPQHHHT